MFHILHLVLHMMLIYQRIVVVPTCLTNSTLADDHSRETLVVLAMSKWHFRLPYSHWPCISSLPTSNCDRNVEQKDFRQWNTRNWLIIHKKDTNALSYRFCIMERNIQRGTWGLVSWTWRLERLESQSAVKTPELDTCSWYVRQTLDRCDDIFQNTVV